MNDTLLSGYYAGQKIENQAVTKPTNLDKCSHGGILDGSSFIPVRNSK